MALTGAVISFLSCTYLLLRPVPVSASCPSGDTSGAIVEGWTCAQMIQYKSFLCYEETTRDKCCVSCESIKTTRAGCEYRNKANGCDSDLCEYYNDDQRYNLCCFSCEPRVTTAKGPTTKISPTTTTAQPTTTTTAGHATTTVEPTTTKVEAPTTTVEHTTTMIEPTSTPEATTTIEPTTNMMEHTTTIIEPTTTAKDTTTIVEHTMTIIEPKTTTEAIATIIEPTTIIEHTTTIIEPKTTITESTTTAERSTVVDTTTDIHYPTNTTSPGESEIELLLQTWGGVMAGALASLLLVCCVPCIALLLARRRWRKEQFEVQLTETESQSADDSIMKQTEVGSRVVQWYQNSGWLSHVNHGSDFTRTNSYAHHNKKSDLPTRSGNFQNSILKPDFLRNGYLSNINETPGFNKRNMYLPVVEQKSDFSRRDIYLPEVNQQPEYSRMSMNVQDANHVSDRSRGREDLPYINQQSEFPQKSMYLPFANRQSYLYFPRRSVYLPDDNGQHDSSRTNVYLPDDNRESDFSRRNTHLPTIPTEKDSKGNEYLGRRYENGVLMYREQQYETDWSRLYASLFDH